DVVDAGLHRYQQIAVRRGHDDREHTGQRKSRQTGGKDPDRQGRNDSVRRAILRQDVAAEDLTAHNTHEVDQHNGHAVYGRTQEHPALCRPSALGGKCALPHFRTCHGENQIGDDVSQNAAVNMRLHQRRVQVGRKVRKAAHVEQGRHRDQDIHEDDQHIKLQHVGVYHAEQAGGGCVDHKDHCCDQRAHLIGEAELSPQHPDDRGRGGDLGGHRPHHGERDQHREGDLGCPAKPPFKQLRDRGDPVLHPDIRDLPGDAGENEHSQKVWNCGKDRLEAVGI
ncbi:Undecaprenyl-diphosphatase, partial [Dysosmobacter welbionis]